MPISDQELLRFKEWQQAGPKRQVKIELGGAGSHSSGNVDIQVWDNELIAWQFNVKTVDDINLEAVVEERDRLHFERLKAKFEPAGVIAEKEAEAKTLLTSF